MIEARAPGKLILLGEHSVVYGHRAIAAAVGLYTRVRLQPMDGPTRVLDSTIHDERLVEAVRLALGPTGWGVSIDTELPVGRGMGSSAALSVALIRAAAEAAGDVLDFETLHARAFPLERVFHGNPSGLDHAVSARGGAVIYRKGEAPAPLPMPPLDVVVLDSGAAGDTAALVSGVASRRPEIDPALDRLGALVEEAAGILDQPLALGGLMNEAHEMLRKCGVSNSRLDDLVALARANGAVGAKLSGAGGGGVVLALTPGGSDRLLRAADERGIHAFATRLPET